MPLSGWMCPRCGSVFAPFVRKCENCVPKTGYADTAEYKALEIASDEAMAIFEADLTEFAPAWKALASR